MLPSSPAQALLRAPIDELTVLLLKQFVRLLADGGLPLTVAEMEALGAQAAAHAPAPAPLCAALGGLVDASAELLQTRFGYTYAESLAHDMSAIGGWETTAEFLELANEKGNAELRISAGSTLLLFLGDASRAAYALDLIAADDGLMDVDAALARRALCHAARVDALAPDWLAQVQAWSGAL